MKKTDTKKTLIIENCEIKIVNSDLLTEDFADVELGSGIKNLIKTGLDTFKNFGKQVWSATVQFAFDYGINRIIKGQTPRDALINASRDLDRRYVRYSEELDRIFEASGVADDVRMAVNLTFLPARGADWYIGNAELQRIKRDVLTPEAIPLWNNIVGRRPETRWLTLPDRRTDSEITGSNRSGGGRPRGSNLRLEIYIDVYNIYIVLAEINSINTGIHRRINNASNVGTSGRVSQRDIEGFISNARRNSRDGQLFRRCLSYLSITTNPDYRGSSPLDNNTLDVIGILCQINAVRNNSALSTRISSTSNHFDCLDTIEQLLQRIRSTTAIQTNFIADATAMPDADLLPEAALIKDKNFLLIENNKILLLKEEEESSKEESGEDESSSEKSGDEDESQQEATASEKDIVQKAIDEIQKSTSENVKADIILYNLAKDISYFCVVLSAYANLENFYVEVVNKLHDGNNSPDNLGAVFKDIQTKMSDSYKQKTELYEKFKDATVDSENLPNNFKDKIVINKNSESLPKFDVKIGALLKDITNNYKIETFKKEAIEPKKEKLGLYVTPSAYLGEDVTRFLENEDAVKKYLNLYLRKNFVDLLLEGDDNLNENMKKLDEILALLTDTLNKISNGVDLSNLMSVANSNNNLSVRVENFNTAMSVMKEIMSSIEKMEERAKALEPLSGELKTGIETILNQFKKEQDQEKDASPKSEDKSQESDQTQSQEGDQQNNQQTSAEQKTEET